MLDPTHDKGTTPVRQRKPAKLTPERLERYYAGLEAGLSKGEASRNIGMSPSQVRHHIATHPDAQHRAQEAMLAAIETVESALFKACVEDRNPACLKFFLINRMPERWHENKRPSVIVHNTDLGVDPNNPDALRAKLAERLEELRAEHALQDQVADEPTPPSPEPHVVVEPSTNGHTGYAIPPQSAPVDPGAAYRQQQAELRAGYERQMMEDHRRKRWGFY
jgi:hypothetical protein